MTHIRYLTLDGLRGIAALCVAFLHMPHFFHYTPPNGYLAVDFFFMLSGFVLAFAYDDRIAGGMSFREFFAIRFTRLYPTYLIGFALGILVALASLKFPGSALSVSWTPKLLVCAIGSGITMLPTPPCDGNDWLYPLNPPMWSIFFELIISVLFFLTHRMLRRPSALIGVILFGSVATVYLYLSVGDANLGFSWSQFWVGLLRVTISFSIGAALFRFWPVRAQTSSAPVTIGLSILCAALLMQPIDGYFYSLLMIFVIFPLLIVIGSRFNPTGIHAPAFAASGAISYIIYAIHKPTYQLFYGALIKFLPAASPFSITMIGVVFFIALAFGCVALERVLERPARKMLTRLWRSRLVTAMSPAPASV
jgi:peptidoglycan/LPS O-acetylase OafA/YrhL